MTYRWVGHASSHGISHLFRHSVGWRVPPGKAVGTTYGRSQRFGIHHHLVVWIHHSVHYVSSLKSWVYECNQLDFQGSNDGELFLYWRHLSCAAAERIYSHELQLSPTQFYFMSQSESPRTFAWLESAYFSEIRQCNFRKRHNKCKVKMKTFGLLLPLDGVSWNLKQNMYII